MFDIKHGDPAAHRKWTKRSNAQIIRNLELVSKRGVVLRVRVPLVPSINDSDKELENIAMTVASALKGVAKIDLLPYHRYGVGKYKMLDRRYRLNNLARPKDADIQRAKQILESFGNKCEVIL